MALMVLGDETDRNLCQEGQDLGFYCGYVGYLRSLEDTELIARLSGQNLLRHSQ